MHNYNFLGKILIAVGSVVKFESNICLYKFINCSLSIFGHVSQFSESKICVVFSGYPIADRCVE